MVQYSPLKHIDGFFQQLFIRGEKPAVSRGSRTHNTVTDPPGLEMIKMSEGKDEKDVDQCSLFSLDRRFP